MKTVIIIVVLLILGVGGFFLGTKLTAPQTQPTSNQTPAPQVIAPANSLVGLLSSQKGLKCDFDNDGDKGIAYIFDGQARIELNATFDDGKYKDLYHMIDTGKLFYIWKNDEKGGVIVPSGILLSSSTLPPVVNPGDVPVTTGGFNSDLDYNYNCVQYKVGISNFLIPTDVTFARVGLATPAP